MQAGKKGIALASLILSHFVPRNTAVSKRRLDAEIQREMERHQGQEEEEERSSRGQMRRECPEHD